MTSRKEVLRKASNQTRQSTHLAPGVFVDEISPFPEAVNEVPTALPAFIGHTERAQRKSAGDLHLHPTQVNSLAEFQKLFGGPHTPNIHVTLTSLGADFTATVTSAASYALFDALKLYFGNGGQVCVVVSVGSYADPIQLDKLSAGLDALAVAGEPTLLVCTESVRLPVDDYGSLVQAMLLQCSVVKNRFAIIDFFGGDVWPDATALQAHRAQLGSQHLMHGAAYYPNLVSSDKPALKRDKSNVQVSIDGAAPVLLGTLSRARRQAHQAALAALLNAPVRVPPSGAVAAVYARTDAQRGVWKAPANVALASVLRPQVVLNDAQQEPLTRDDTGKGINAIRSFTGKGTVVWGARTLAGNDNEWRYVPVRRFFNMVEASIKNSTAWVVLEANGPATWARLRAMVESYLMIKWQEGALVGSKPEHAFFVRCGLGSTMTEQDITAGRLLVQIGMALVRPAEFTSININYQLAVD
jgi:uncharacterized protein